jgi:NADH-quinone oxidoreductase subunit L
MLVGVAIFIFLLAFILQYRKYVLKSAVPEEDNEMSKSALVLANKLYVDEAYDKMFVEPTETLGDYSSWFDRNIIGLIPKSIKGWNTALARLNARVQNGNIEYYLVYMSLAVFLVLFLSAICLKLWN